MFFQITDPLNDSTAFFNGFCVYFESLFFIYNLSILEELHIMFNFIYFILEMLVYFLFRASYLSWFPFIIYLCYFGFEY